MINKDKPLLACACLLMLVAATGHGALSVTIAGGGDSPLFNSSGTALSSATLAFQLMIDAGSANQATYDTDFAGVESSGMLNVSSDSAFLGGVHASMADDVVAGEFYWTYVPGDELYYLDNDPLLEVTFDEIADGYSSSHYYIRWFNSSDTSAATEAGFIYSANNNWITPASDDLTVPTREMSYFEYTTTDRVPGNDGSEYIDQTEMGWQTIAPIPEPGTIGLFLIGAGVLAYRKRRTA